MKSQNLALLVNTEKVEGSFLNAQLQAIMHKSPERILSSVVIKISPCGKTFWIKRAFSLLAKG